MLDTFIIEELKRREKERRRRVRRPALEIPADEHHPTDYVDYGESSNEKEGNRGVIIIDYNT